MLCVRIASPTWRQVFCRQYFAAKYLAAKYFAAHETCRETCKGGRSSAAIGLKDLPKRVGAIHGSVTKKKDRRVAQV
jgi:hypothetical protein